MNSHETECRIDIDFKGKFVVLFDDVRTSGKSLEHERQTLEGFGATVICAITLGQTSH